MADAKRPGPHAEETLRILSQTHAVIENDHCVYISGDHGSGWIDKDAIFPHTEHLAALCRDLADEVKEWGIEVVCGPATGGLIVAEWTAHGLGMLFLFTEHDPAPHGRRDGRRSVCVPAGAQDSRLAGRRMQALPGWGAGEHPLCSQQRVPCSTGNEGMKTGR